MQLGGGAVRDWRNCNSLLCDGLGEGEVQEMKSNV